MKRMISGSRAKWLFSNHFRISLITLLLIGVLILVRLTGGAPNAYMHLIYIPIILSAYCWGTLGGISVALVGGILVSPLMPLGISQEILGNENNWVIRLLIFAFVGFITGYIFKKVDWLNQQAKKNDLINPLTGAHNTNKLINDLGENMDKGERFSIVSIKLTNIEQIGKYMYQMFIKDVLNKLVGELSDTHGKDAVYTSGYDEINLLISPSCEYLEECRGIIERHSRAFKVNQFTFKIFMKIGIYEYGGSGETPIDVYNKARIAYEQGTHQQDGIYFYDEEFDLERKGLLEISGSLLEAIKNNEFYLVYQPKINIAEDRISGVEILTRWDRKGEPPVGPDVFIKLAEDIGLIKEISKFVLDNSFNQMLDWNNKGIALDFSINFTANELLENHFAEWERKVTESENILLDKLELEITERVLSQNTDKIIERIDELRAKGIKVSIDDFGTGVNSLLRMAEFPYDQIKLDKYFIDRIHGFEIRGMIKAIIEHSHRFGKEVVAEGVETEEQLKILRELNCDMVQGYYYSKPLRPDEFEQYFLNFKEGLK